MGSTVQKIILCLTRTCSLIAPGYHYYQYSLLLSISLKLFCAWLAGLADGGQHISRPLRQLQLRRLLLQVSTYPTKISVKTIILLLQAGLAARAHCRRWSCIDIANNITNHQSQLITTNQTLIFPQTWEQWSCEMVPVSQQEWKSIRDRLWFLLHLSLSHW